ncbi:hypothetical protein V1517DRAFT_331365 [Lipomyces orientalis]|uniref:Uncharacterized protein n=1 Tax=Lipomyces orientalis TaxID=1233043 RepID=A0ACC3TGF0_9ASCO
MAMPDVQRRVPSHMCTVPGSANIPVARFPGPMKGNLFIGSRQTWWILSISLSTNTTTRGLRTCSWTTAFGAIIYLYRGHFERCKAIMVLSSS